MNRKIKFRGHRVDNKEWIYGNYSDMSDIVSTWIFIELAHNGQRERHIVIPETICQFTGLKDKNGVEIYEGDILQYEEFGYITKDVVIFNCGAFKRQYINEDGSESKLPFTTLSENKVEVIGSIHSNPELCSK